MTYEGFELLGEDLLFDVNGGESWLKTLAGAGCAGGGAILGGMAGAGAGAAFAGLPTAGIGAPAGALVGAVLGATSGAAAGYMGGRAFYDFLAEGK